MGTDTAMAVRLTRLASIIVMMLSLLGTLKAQGYCVTIHFPAESTGRVVCSFYSNDSLPQRRYATIRHGEAVFRGTAAKPHLVEVAHRDLPTPISFFIENSNIDIEANLDNPAASRITGSRANSQYRYALEDWSGDVLQFVRSHPSDPFTPHFLLTRISDLDGATLQSALSLLQGEARSTYHYRQLLTKASSIMASTEGARMPDFEYMGPDHKPVHFDSVRTDSIPSILLVTATYSPEGRKIAQQIRAQYPQLGLHVINIDHHPLSWDAPYLEILAVDRIPYMILLAPEGIIHTRDARLWELPRLLPTL